MQLHIRVCVTGGSLSEHAKDQVLTYLNREAMIIGKNFNIEWELVDSMFIKLHQLEMIDNEIS